MNPTDLLLRWPAPAADWNGAAPVGNGRLGAMVFGGTHRARIQINDSTVWSGTPAGPRRRSPASSPPAPVRGGWRRSATRSAQGNRTGPRSS